MTLRRSLCSLILAGILAGGSAAAALAQGLPGYKITYFDGELPLPSPSVAFPEEDWPEVARLARE